MAFDYSKSAATADKILTKFGQDITITRRTAGTYNTSTGTATVTETTQTGTGAIFDWANRNIDGILIKTGDRRLLLSAVGLTAPVVNDTVTVGTTVFTIVQVSPFSPAGTVVMYELNLRGTV